MKRKQIVILGFDCLGHDIFTPEILSELPVLQRLIASGMSGTLKSTIPPITVPAWTCMLSGRDPGELGIYGFRNRNSYATYNLQYADSRSVKQPRIWDKLDHSIIIGVPQTWPALKMPGVLVSGFEAGTPGSSADVPFTWPQEIADRVSGLENYHFDVPEFRNSSKQDVKELVYHMTAQRFRLFEQFTKEFPWQLAMLCEIGPDRLHHCFWADHDPSHPMHAERSPHKTVIRDYYRFLDKQVGMLLDSLDDDTTIFAVSDHGAKAMHGGVCINDLLIKEGWLVLKNPSAEGTFLTAEMINWEQTRVWASGGFYARIFLNVKGRDSQGIVPAEQVDEIKKELTALLRTIDLGNGVTLHNDIFDPKDIYQSVRGIPPDLIVHFGDLHWRSIGSVGHDSIWRQGNDTGYDEANHSMDGLFILSGPGIPTKKLNATIYDVYPTLLDIYGLEAPNDLRGKSILKHEELAGKNN